MVEQKTSAQVKEVAQEIGRLIIKEYGKGAEMLGFRQIGEGETANVYAFTLDRHFTARLLSKSASDAGLASEAIRKLKKYNLAPAIIHLFPAATNALERDILILEEPVGETLSAKNFDDRVFSDLVVELLRVHHNRQTELVDPSALGRKLGQESGEVLAQLMEHLPSLAPELLDLVAAMQAYLVANEAIFRVPQSLVHGDLYWANVLVTPRGEAVLIDWLGLSCADYCVDLATFRVGFLRCSPHGTCFGEGAPVEAYYQKLLEIYHQTFSDQTIIERLHFYLPAIYIGDVYALLRGAGGLAEDLCSKVATYLKEARLAFDLDWGAQ